MKAGLFVCDHVLPQYRVEFGDYPDMFAKLFPEFEFELFDVVNGHFPDDLDACDVYLCTGSKHGVYDQLDWIEELKETVQQIYAQDKYFIGFCFGHQIIGEALGGNVEKSSNGWCIGVHEFQINQFRGWMKEEAGSFNIIMLCQDQIVKLPPNAHVLAGNKQCPNGMIQVGEKILGIQGHPEFSKEYDRLIFESRTERIGMEVVQQGIKSLDKEIDQIQFKNWILRFWEYNSNRFKCS